jgi:hypothetical protein
MSFGVPKGYVPIYEYGMMYYCCDRPGIYVSTRGYWYEDAAEKLGCKKEDLCLSAKGWWAGLRAPDLLGPKEGVRVDVTEWIGPFVNHDESREELERYVLHSSREQGIKKMPAAQRSEPEPVSDKKRLMDFFFGDPNRDKPPGDGGGFMGIPKSLQRRRRR